MGLIKGISERLRGKVEPAKKDQVSQPSQVYGQTQKAGAGSGAPPVSRAGASTSGASKKPGAGGGLNRVKHIVAIASGKGGVGKSTTTINLARALAKQGLKVGVLDADIYGPSLDILSKVGRPEQMDGALVIPPVVQGLSMISISMFSSKDKAQVLRGPMAANLIRQFLDQVSWGALDYLLIDYPPGTGDIQLTISQIANVTGAILVTTPQELALADVRKALTMFEALKVPVVGIVENMSYFLCDGCDKKHYVFSEGGGRVLAGQRGLPLLAEVPIDIRIRKNSDEGIDFIADPEQQLPSSALYMDLAQKVVHEVSEIRRQSAGGLGSFSLTWRAEQSGEVSS